MTSSTTAPAVNTKVPALVRLPLIERRTIISGTSVMNTSTLMEVDGVGLYVFHNYGQAPDHDTVRRHLTYVTDTYCYIEATSREDAERIFHEEWDGAKTGRKAKALVINRKPWAVSKAFPECPHMYRGKGDSLICGESQDDGLNGKYGGCILSGYAAPSFCPIALAEEKDPNVFKAPNPSVDAQV
jgi:hypothetical protein